MSTVRPIRDTFAEDIKVSQFLNNLLCDASSHMITAGEFALKRDWNSAEVHLEIALDRVRMHNEVEVEMDNYK